VAACEEYALAASLFDSQEDSAAAAQLWSRIVAIDPDQTEARQRLAEHRLKTGDTAEALKELVELARWASKENRTAELEQALEDTQTRLAELKRRSDRVQEIGARIPDELALAEEPLAA